MPNQDIGAADGDVRAGEPVTRGDSTVRSQQLAMISPIPVLDHVRLKRLHHDSAAVGAAITSADRRPGDTGTGVSSFNAFAPDTPDQFDSPGASS